MAKIIRKIIRKLLRILAKSEIKQRNFALGMTSFTFKNKLKRDKDLHMLFLDYDEDLNLNEVLNDCDELCNFFKLSDYEIIKSKRGYHCFWWFDNNIPYSRLKMIIDYSRCDTSYKYISRFYDHKTIRASGKYKITYDDLVYVGKFKGVRVPAKDEREIGELKKQEYLELKKLNIFQDNVLK